ncbi:MAG: hypothetical protein LBC61_02390 [Candidatus Peribacteria bacterium]|nr:hypothetical protein [Candidatus Peribacteria bacterium]
MPSSLIPGVFFHDIQRTEKLINEITKACSYMNNLHLQKLFTRATELIIWDIVLTLSLYLSGTFEISYK